MQRLLSYLLIILLSAIWMVGCSAHLQTYLSQQGMLPDDYRYGDLYRLSNLSAFKQSRTTCKRTPASPRLPIHLYVVGDSFLEKQRISLQDFGVQRYTYTHWKDTLKVQLDTAAVNVLLLETVERHSREHLAARIRNYEIGIAPTLPSRSPDWLDMVFPNKVEEKLERLLFSNDIALFFRELKADLNYRLFGRVNDQVAISKGGKAIFTSMDTDTTQIRSSYKALNNSELHTLVQHLNEAQVYYQKQGFDAVLMSVIPNKASILAPEDGSYNHLIERLEQHPHLQVPAVSVYGAFAQDRQRYYERSDSHWNCAGEQLWLNEANRHLKTVFTQKTFRYQLTGTSTP
jgi:hypothetical protein